MEENFSPRVRDVITYSKEEALRLGHDYIGTEHLLLGILRDGEGTAVAILRDLGLDLSNVRIKLRVSLHLMQRMLQEREKTCHLPDRQRKH